MESLLIIVALSAVPFTVHGITQPVSGRTATIAPPVTQAIFTAEDLRVTVGDEVHAGQVLIMLRDPKAAVRKRELELSLAQTELEGARIALWLAEKTLARANTLLPSNAISVADHEIREYGYRKALNDIAVADQRVRNAEQALVQTSTPIIAAINGTVTSLSVRPGDAAGPGREKMVWGEILNIDVLDVACAVTEPVSKGISVTVTAGGSYSLPGVVVFLSPVLTNDQKRPVLIRVENTQRLLRCNQRVEVQFP